MSEQVDTKALRAHANGMRNLRFYVFDLDPDDDNDQRVFARDEDGDVHLVEEMPRKAKEAICALVNAAPALLDAADERDKMHTRLRNVSHTIVASIGADGPMEVEDAVLLLFGQYAHVLSQRDALRAENEALKAHEVEVTTDAVLAASENFTLRNDSDAMLAEIRRLEAENGRLREAARAVCEGTMSSEVALGLRILRAALAPRAEVKP